MKILIVVEHSPKQRFLVSLHSKELAGVVKDLIGRGRHSHAIATALARGRFEKEVLERDLAEIKADLILTEKNASWDLARRD